MKNNKSPRYFNIHLTKSLFRAGTYFRLMGKLYLNIDKMIAKERTKSWNIKECRIIIADDLALQRKKLPFTLQILIKKDDGTTEKKN